MKVATIQELGQLRRLKDLNEINLHLTSLLRGNLPLYSVRSAFWSLRKGGMLSVYAPTTVDSVSLAPAKWSFQMLTQLAVNAAQGLGEIRRYDLSTRTLLFERTADRLAPSPWSAAIIYSGKSSERTQLAACIERLMMQPEIKHGGQLLVCGPAEARHHVSGLPDVEYAVLPTPMQAGRFLIGQKKMHAMRALRHERVLVCHTRVLLEPGCLEAIPDEFDLITPRVWARGAGGTLPYLDMGFFDNRSAGLYTTKIQPPVYYNRNAWLSMLGKWYPYIDGGLFCVRRSLAMEIPMSESIAWGEGEDAEWGLRLIANGKLLEIALDAAAYSQTCKMHYYGRWGHLAAYRHIMKVARMVKELKRRLPSV